MKTLILDVENKTCKKIKSMGFGALSSSINYHLKNKTYKEDALSPKNAVFISTGPFMGLDIPGCHRLIISGKSPQVDTFFLTTLGGGAIELSKTGINTIVIKGKSEHKTVILIKNAKGRLNVRFEEAEAEPADTYKFQEELIKKYSSYYEGLDYRILAVGPAALNTNMGGINSLQIKNDKLVYGSEGWAGRGGFGSLLAQAHNVTAVIFGGDYKFKKKFDSEKLFEKEFKKTMIKTIYDATEKYRFVESIKTGGTYGVNFFNESDRTLWFNWQSIKLDKKTRQELYEKNIQNHFLKQFNDTVIKDKSFKTCGEACPAVCKKVNKKKKKDYEPCAACGPQCAIFDMHHVERVTTEVDNAGFDAIEIGNVASCVFECVIKGLIDKKDFLMESTPVMNPKITLEDSNNNSRIAAKLVRDISLGRIPLLSKGLREACRSNEKLKECAVYASYGEKGVISPCVYFVPGFLVPLPIQGKFHTYYGKDFLEPYQLGKKSLERAIIELYFEEGGVCRFHRAWAENMIPVLAKKTGLKLGMKSHAKNMLKDIKKYDQLAGSNPEYFETRKTKELLYYHILSYLENTPSKEGIKWKKLFEQDFESASKKYWDEMLRGVKL